MQGKRTNAVSTPYKEIGVYVVCEKVSEQWIFSENLRKEKEQTKKQTNILYLEGQQ